MTTETFFALIIFTVVGSITPGPANFMLLASGVNFGLRRMLPCVYGILTGYLSLFLAIGLGIGSLLSTFPFLEVVLKFAGGGYLLYLAVRIALNRTPIGTGEQSKAKPLSFIEGAVFSWLNPKAWILFTSTLAIYVNPQQPAASVLVLLIVTGLVDFPTILIWAAFGSSIRSLISTPTRLKFFNISMGVMLAAIVVFIVVN